MFPMKLVKFLPAIAWGVVLALVVLALTPKGLPVVIIVLAALALSFIPFYWPLRLMRSPVGPLVAFMVAVLVIAFQYSLLGRIVP